MNCRTLVIALSVGAVAGCAGHVPAPTVNRPSSARTGAQAPECSGRPALPTYQHVIWIFMENHRYGQVIGNPAAPFETGLARRCGTATRYASVGSPSLANYIGATSGDTFGITDDGGPTSHPLTADNVFRQVRSSGGQARSYQEAMPAACSLDSKGDYAVKHNPAAYYVGPDDRRACTTDDVALGTPASGALADALDRDALPTFSFITPDLCHDTHNCGVDVGDAWLARWVPRLTASAAYRSAMTAIFVVWDEYTPMPFIAISPSTPPGSVSEVAVDHYSLLRTTEELLGIGELLGSAAQATSMRSVFGL